MKNIINKNSTLLKKIKNYFKEQMTVKYEYS